MIKKGADTVNKVFKKLNNNGATLVMVIVCMLFIGIISVAVLALAMGNFGSTQTVEESSKNFYTTEVYTDSLKLLLQQEANKAAQSAYMTQLTNGVVEKNALESSFRSQLADTFQTVFASEDDIKNQIQAKTSTTLADYTIKIPYITENQSEFDTFKNDFVENGILRNVEVSYLEPGTGYMTTLCSDFQFSINAPGIMPIDPEKKFAYDVDKYVFISDSDIDLGVQGDTLAGNNIITGNLYASGDISVNVNSSLSINAKNIVAANKDEGKGNIIINSGSLTHRSFNEQFYDVYRTDYDRADENNSNVWCDNYDIKGGDVTLSTTAYLYLGDDLTLDGDGTGLDVQSFSEPGDNGGIVAYSTNPDATGTTATVHKNSGSIVINGKNTTLNLANLKKLYLAGLAYTEVPGVAGDDNSEKKYFVQGESLTYKSLQSIYLVDGSLLYYNEGVEKVYVGSNPMKKEVFDKWCSQCFSDYGATGNPSFPDGIPNIDSQRYTTKEVTYVNGGTYVYVYWNFIDSDYAVDYFSDVTSSPLSGDERIKQRLSAGLGSITLPTSTEVSAKGNLISYDGSTPGYVTGGLSYSASAECSKAKKSYNNIKTSFSTEFKMDTPDSNDPFDIFKHVLFAGDKLDKITEKKIYDLTAPTQDVDNGCMKLVGSNVEKDTDTYEYKLYVCNTDLDLSSYSFDDSTTKYIIVCKGRVTFKSATNFKGIVFAKNGVVVNGTGNKFECLGNYKYKTADGSYQYKTEFDAILSVEDDSNPGNVLLRKIFGVDENDGDSEDAEPIYDFTDVRAINFIKK